MPMEGVSEEEMLSQKANVCVSTMDGELFFTVSSSATAKDIFDQVVSSLEVTQPEYFGLQCEDSKGYTMWLKLNKMLIRQDIKEVTPLQLNFRVMLYPVNIVSGSLHNVTAKLLYMQVKQAILFEEIYCPPEIALLLASYSLQATHGEFDPELYSSVQEKDDEGKSRLVPLRVKDIFYLDPSALHTQIKDLWRKAGGLKPEQAIMEYLALAQNLKMYGVQYFLVKNKQDVDLWLGVTPLGLNIYGWKDKLNPQSSLGWKSIRDVGFNECKLVIRPIDKSTGNTVLRSARLRITKRILAACLANHDLYLRRKQSMILWKVDNNPGHEGKVVEEEEEVNHNENSVSNTKL